MASPLVHELSASDFDATIKGANVPVLVDFWAPWCGPCRALGPTIEEIAEELGDAAKICKVNVDSEPDLAAKYDVMSIPTVLIFKNGELAKTFVGVQPKATLLSALR